MLKIIDSVETTPYEGINKKVSTILKFNKIPQEKVSWFLPDKVKNYNYNNFDDYFNFMERIDGTDEFIKFVKEHKNEPSICISDHDCDGIMACVICSVSLYNYGIDMQYIATDRFVTGYGMKKSSIDEAYKAGAKVIYTVDQGITCNDAIDYAHSLGMKVCVTDHHNGFDLSHADCVIDPCYYLNKTEFKKISGATVMLKLAYELFKSDNLSLDGFEDLAALAGITVLSDCMPLVNENRILYHSMINYCNKNNNIEGSFISRLSTLLSFFMPGNYTTVEVPFEQIPHRGFNKTSIDFYFVPVVNALNRVYGNVNSLISDIISLYYGQTDNINYGVYAEVNKERKEMKKSMSSLHVYDANASVCIEAYDTGVLENLSGISGLVASDIVENEKKPALIGIMPLSGNIIKFSGRSVPGYNLYELLRRIKEDHPELGLNFGGHAEALGASIPKENLIKFREIACKYYSDDKYELNEELFLLDNPTEWMRIFAQYGPFGNGFVLPKFYTKTSVKFCDFKTRVFKLANCGNTEILCYSYTDWDYIKQLATKNRTVELECTLELVFDETGKVKFKLVNILNYDQDVIQQILEERNNYIS